MRTEDGDVELGDAHLRYLTAALDIAGAGLLASGLILLAGLVHPYLAIAAAGAVCLAVAFLLERPRKDSQ